MSKEIKGNLQKVQITTPVKGDRQISKIVDESNPLPVTVVGGNSGGGGNTTVDVVVNKTYARKNYVQTIEGAIEGDSLVVSLADTFDYYVLVKQFDDKLKFEFVTRIDKEEK